MAYTKIWSVNHHPERVHDYATNPVKTADRSEMQRVFDYATSGEKTEQKLFVTGINCNPDTAIEEMRITKERWNKTDSILLFHGIQSFAEGETDPETAHRVGIEFARRMFGERFELTVSTHLDKSCLHNHFVINSVSFVDGKRYYDNKTSYYGQIRIINDEVCREFGLSVIAAKGKGKHYTERQAEKEKRPTVRREIARELDEVIRFSYSLQNFFDNLKKRGYKIRRGDTITHTSITPPGGRAIRLDSFLKATGVDYSEHAIAERIKRQRKNIDTIPERRRSDHKDKDYRRFRSVKPVLPMKQPRIKMKGLSAAYFRYILFFTRPGKKRTPAPVLRLTRYDYKRMKKLKEQLSFLQRNRIQSYHELNKYETYLDSFISSITDRRRDLYPQKRRGLPVDGEIKALTAKLRTLRTEKRIINQIREKEPDIAEKIQLYREYERKRKERDRERFGGKIM